MFESLTSLTGGGAITPNTSDNGHISSGPISFGDNSVKHGPVNIGGSTVNSQKWLFVAGGLGVAFLLYKMRGKK